MIRRELGRLVGAQDAWGRPLGDVVHRVLGAIFRPIRPVRDLLNGTWLGHPLHPAITDVPIGAFFVAIVLDVAGQSMGAFLAIAVGQVAFLGSVVTGLADHAETDGRARARATVHGVVMLVGGVLTAASLVTRSGGSASGTIPMALLILGFLVIAAGAYVGGDVVFALGNMVDRHAWRVAAAKWQRLEVEGLADLDGLPELKPTKAKLGINALVLVRVGATIHALHNECAHAGASLAGGKIAGDCIECPFHGSRFRLADGRATRGPAVYDQPAYEVRRGEAGWEARRSG
jgi:nitrite reductase/ring-hydroxylating ferredoxin subunit